jgi:short-subunit dehydrogenase
MGSRDGRIERFRRGVRPAVCGTRSAPGSCGAPIGEASGLASELRDRYRVDVLVEQVDLSEIPAVIDLHKRLSERGTEIGVLINNAGHGLQGPFLDEPLDKAMTMLDLNVVSMTAVTRRIAEDMRSRGHGQILLVASLLAFEGVENFAVYSASKAYVLRLGEALHRELKRYGLRVTELCPGMSATGFAATARQKITPENHTRAEAFDDAARPRSARRDSRAGSRTR